MRRLPAKAVPCTRVRYIWEEGALRHCHLTSYLSGAHHHGVAGAIILVCRPWGCHPPRLPPFRQTCATLRRTIGERHQSLI